MVHWLSKSFRKIEAGLISQVIETESSGQGKQVLSLKPKHQCSQTRLENKIKDFLMKIE